jgi:hypothetical protein
MNWNKKLKNLTHKGEMKRNITGRIVDCTYMERYLSNIWLVGYSDELEYYHNEIVGLYGLLIG